jgi:hypothetical protein
MDALTLHRIHFAFTITYHYLFPQLTMGLALLIVVLKTMALRTNDERYNIAARSGRAFFQSISCSASSPASRWSFSSARIGQSFPGVPVA